jgi:hypothetical protein
MAIRLILLLSMMIMNGLAKNCNVTQDILDKEEEVAFVNCTPESNNHTYDPHDIVWFIPTTVCIFTCKSKPYRLKHRCNRSGKWDIPPGYKSCADLPMPECEHPDTTMTNYDWNCTSDVFDPGATCQGVCKYNATDFPEIEVICNGKGHWKVLPEEAFTRLCLPYDVHEVQNPCPGVFFNPDILHGNIHCTTSTVKSAPNVVKTCVLNCDYGYVPTSTEVFWCRTLIPIEDSSPSYEWATSEGLIIQPQDNLTCEQPLAFIAGGYESQFSQGQGLELQVALRSVEIYHPTKAMNLTIQDMPLTLYDTSGFWFDGKLIICGKATATTTYEINCLKLNQSGFKWEYYQAAKDFVRTVGTTFARPQNDRRLYVIGGTGNFSKAIKVFDLIGGITEINHRVFELVLGDHCSFSIDDRIVVLSKCHLYNGQVSKQSAWTVDKLSFDLTKPLCIPVKDNLTVLVVDVADGNKFLCKAAADYELRCRPVQFDLERQSLVGSRMAILEGKISILGGQTQIVEQIEIFDVNDVLVTSGKNHLSTENRYQFALISVPESFFRSQTKA